MKPMSCRGSSGVMGVLGGRAGGGEVEEQKVVVALGGGGGGRGEEHAGTGALGGAGGGISEKSGREGVSIMIILSSLELLTGALSKDVIVLSMFSFC